MAAAAFREPARALLDWMAGYLEGVEAYPVPPGQTLARLAEASTATPRMP